MSPTASSRTLFASRPGTRLLIDIAIALAAYAGSVAQLAHGGIPPTTHAAADLDPAGALLAAGSVAPLLVWRRLPLGVLVATAAVSALAARLGYPIDTVLGPPAVTAALYLLAASRDRAHRWTWRTTVVVAGALGAYLAVAVTGLTEDATGVVLHTCVAAAAAWLAGERTRLRRDQVATYVQRARQAERWTERERLLAVAEERARIARDLHDSAGHAISVIAVRAGAARLHRDPARSERALADIEKLARDTVGDIDRLVGNLRARDDGAPAALGDLEAPPPPGPAPTVVEAPPGLASVGSLIDATGLDVRRVGTGDPRPLGGAADQAAYRILQEALTNAARYGTGSATLALAYGPDTLDLTVTNPIAPGPVEHTGHAGINEASRTGGGHGLIGMRERATLLGGRLATERTDGVFRLRASIPYGGHGA